MNTSQHFTFETQIGIGIYTILYLPITGILNFGIITFEKFGGNPQKRGLHNMLLSLLLELLLLHNCLSAALSSLRICYGKERDLKVPIFALSKNYTAKIFQALLDFLLDFTWIT